MLRKKALQFVLNVNHIAGSWSQERNGEKNMPKSYIHIEATHRHDEEVFEDIELKVNSSLHELGGLIMLILEQSEDLYRVMKEAIKEHEELEAKKN